MFMNLLVVWLLISVFVGSREANRFARTVFGILAVVWIIKVLVGFGLGLLPLILLIAVFSRVVVPFLKGFFSRF